MITIRDNMQQYFPTERDVDDFLNIEGEVFRQSVASRKTSRFERDSKGFFIKAHWGVGWREILKNLLYLRLPVLGAGNEVRAIRKLEQLGIDTMSIVAFGTSGSNPATIKSFLVTEELTDTKQLDHWLENDFKKLDRRQQVQLKRKLVSRLAHIARQLHRHGVNHRDFYLCHFLAKLPLTPATPESEIKLYLIDLHRAQIRNKVPRRWLVKDLAGLYYSSMDMDLTRRDYFRFIKTYTDTSLRNALGQQPGFWRDVADTARRLYKKQQGK